MSPHSIAIITDSTCDLPDEIIAEYTIQVVPLQLIWGTQTLRDRFDIDAEDFYRRLVSDPVHPTTSQPSPADFVTALRQAQADGAQEAIIFTISGQMSNTYNSARLAESMVDFPVHVVDSKANSMSLGWQLLAAARVRDARGSAADIIAAAERVRSHTSTVLYVDTLEYLQKGGRISLAARWVGTILDLKPLLHVDHRTGKIEPHSRARTRRQALDKMYTTFFSQLDTSQPLHVAIMHSGTLDLAHEIAERIRQEYHPVETVIAVTSPVMGVHTGPGALALCGCAGDF
ncbi:MAG: DegV family protein [Anaerolineaceae bacterium]|nr:DegV family protein [Anaerolineaceae bacterium]